LSAYNYLEMVTAIPKPAWRFALSTDTTN